MVTQSNKEMTSHYLVRKSIGTGIETLKETGHPVIVCTVCVFELFVNEKP